MRGGFFFAGIGSLEPRGHHPSAQLIGVDGAAGFGGGFRNLDEPGLERFQERSPFRIGFPHGLRLKLFLLRRPVYEVYRSQV